MTESIALALPLIREFEGLRLSAYLCPAGVWTIGYGHTSGVVKGQKTTIGGAAALLQVDAERALRDIRKLVKVPLVPRQEAALVSFVFNLGAGNLAGSSLLRMLNAGNYAAVPGQLFKWTKARVNGQLVELDGLVRRRKAEAKMWGSA